MNKFETYSTTKRTGILLSAIVVFLFLLPLIARSCPGNAAMVLTFVLFYVLNPIFVLIVGYLSGGQWRKMWYLPCAAALVFLLSSWVLFTKEEIMFVQFAVIYLGIGVFGMLLSIFLNRSAGRNR